MPITTRSRSKGTKSSRAVQSPSSESLPESSTSKTDDSGVVDKDDHKMESTETTSAVMKGARMVFSQALITKLLTFSMNIYLVRLSTFSTLGHVYDLEFYYGTLLYLSREMVRMAITRNLGVQVNQRQRTQLLVNIGYLPFLISLPLLSIICGYLHMTSTGMGQESITLAFTYPFWIYIVGALLELLAEPGFTLLQSNLLFERRVHVESAAFIVQSGMKLILLIRVNQLTNPDMTSRILCYAYAQLGYSITMSFGYWIAFTNASIRKRITGTDCSFISLMLPARVKLDKTHVWFDSYLFNIARSFGAQTVLKHFLSMGDRIGMSRLGLDAHDKGVYAVVSDLGGLVARIVFQPLEETSRSLFSKNLTNRSDKEMGRMLHESIDFMATLIQFQVYFGSVFLFWGSNFTSTLLKIYRKASPEAISVLSVYCAYIPVMGVNGISEGFVQAVGDNLTLAYQSYFMIILWFLYFACLYALSAVLGMGTEAIVWCNIITMMLRIVFNFWFIHRFIAHQKVPAADISEATQKMSLFAILPRSVLVWISFLVSWLVTRFTSRMVIHLWNGKGELVHILVGGATFLFSILILYYTERNKFISRLRHYLSMMRG